jgi:hypothetical protein
MALKPGSINYRKDKQIKPNFNSGSAFLNEILSQGFDAVPEVLAIATTY